MVTAKGNEDALLSVMVGILTTCYSSEVKSDKSQQPCYYCNLNLPRDGTERSTDIRLAKPEAKRKRWRFE